MKKAKTVDAYIKAAPKDVRAKLIQLRRIIKTTAPGALEKISYGMPYYGYKGRLAYFAAQENHIGLYLMHKTLEKHEAETKRYRTGKATLRFPFDKPLPAALIKKLIKTGVRLNEKSAS